MLIGNGVLVTLGFLACAMLTADTPHWLVCALLFVTGMTRSMQFTAMNTIGFADVPQPQMSHATTLFSVLQQMSAGMGIAIGALALSVAGVVHGTAQAAPGVSDFHLAFVMIAAMAALAIVDCAMLPRNAGERVLARGR